MKSVKILFVVFCLFSCSSDYGSPLIGNTYSMTFYPLDPNNREQVGYAQAMNKFGFSAEFINDSIFTLRRPNEVTNNLWKMEGDSINFGGSKYLFTTLGQSFMLLQADQKLELTPWH